mgnify:CR=1 FL=1
MKAIVITRPGPPDVLALVPPVHVRRWKASPLPALTIIDACFEPAVSVSRIITPALLQFATGRTLSTRRVIEPSPVSCL